jgi:hypothetical protein
MTAISVRDAVERFTFAREEILKGGYRFFPDHSQSPLVIEREGYDACLFMYSVFFNDAVTAFLRGWRDLGAGATVKDIISYMGKKGDAAPSRGRMSPEETVETLKGEYLFIGTEARRVIVPLCVDVKPGGYVRGGLLHVLLNHYDKLPSTFAASQDKSLFPQSATVNEVLGALVSTVVEGIDEGSSARQLKLTAEVEVMTPDAREVLPYLLVAEKADASSLYRLVTFFPKRDRDVGA